MSEFGLSMKIGDRRRFRITATWPATVPELGVTKGDPYNLSTATKVWFFGKINRSDADASALVQKDSTKTALDDITFGTGADTNKAYVWITETDLASLAAATRSVKLLCECQVKAASGEIWTVAEGELTLTPQIVQATS